MIVISESGEEKSDAEIERDTLREIDDLLRDGKIQRGEWNRRREGVIYQRNLKETQDAKDKKAHDKEMEKLKAESEETQGRKAADELLSLVNPEQQDDEIVLRVAELIRTGKWDMLPDARKIIDGMTSEQRRRVEELS